MFSDKTTSSSHTIPSLTPEVSHDSPSSFAFLETYIYDSVKKFFSKYKRIGASVRNRVNEMVDVELIKEPVMMVMCISNVLAMLGFYVPFMFIIDMAAEKGIATADASLLLSAIGITNTLGCAPFFQCCCVCFMDQISDIVNA